MRVLLADDHALVRTGLARYAMRVGLVRSEA